MTTVKNAALWFRLPGGWGVTIGCWVALFAAVTDLIWGGPFLLWLIVALLWLNLSRQEAHR